MRTPVLASDKHTNTTLILAISVIIIFSAIAISLSFSRTIFFGSRNVASVVQSSVLSLINTDRSLINVSPLSHNQLLDAIAQAKANDMASKGYFAHIAPDGTEPWYWYGTYGYKFDYAGENIAMDFSDSAEVYDAWMQSPLHRQNILDPKFTEVGMATAEGMYNGRMTTFIAQEFGTPAGTSYGVTNSTSPPVNNTSRNGTLNDTDITKGSVLGDSTDNQNMFPWWGYIASFPRATLHYAYYAFALSILLGLAIDTEMQIHRRHRGQAIRAGIALAMISLIFYFINILMIAKPILA